MARASKYDQMHRDLMDFILNGNMHSTLVGKVVSLSGNEKSDLESVEELVEYVTSLAEKSEKFRKDNVKKASRHL